MDDLPQPPYELIGHIFGECYDDDVGECLDALMRDIPSTEWYDRLNGEVFLSSHQEFNPFTIHNELIRKEPTESILQKDLLYLAFTYAVRGTNFKKMMYDSSPDFVEELQRLVLKYSITDGVPSDDKTLTMARIAGTVPHMVCLSMQFFEDEALLVNPQLLPNKYPRIVMNVQFACLIPRNIQDITLQLAKAHLLYLVHLDQAINHGKTSLRALVELQTSAMDRPIFSDEERLKFCMENNVIIQIGDVLTLAETLVTAATVLNTDNSSTNKLYQKLLSEVTDDHDNDNDVNMIVQSKMEEMELDANPVNELKEAD